MTLKGTTAAANITKVLAALKGISNATIVVGIALDFGRAVFEPEYRGKAAINTAVTVVAYIVGGTISAPLGLVIGGGYLLLDQTGALKPNLIQTNFQQPICPQDNTKTTIPYK